MHTSLNITYIYLILHDNFNDLYCTPLWAWECCVQYKIHLNRVHLTTPLSSKPPRFVAVLPRTNGVLSVDSSNRLRNFVSAFAMTHCNRTVPSAGCDWQTGSVYIAQLICTDMSSVLVVRKSMLPGGRKQCKLNQKGQYKNLLMKKNRQLYDCRFLQKLQKRGNFKLWNLINVSLKQFP